MADTQPAFPFARAVPVAAAPTVVTSVPAARTALLLGGNGCARAGAEHDLIINSRSDS